MPSIGSNTQHGPRGTLGAAAHLLGQHLVIGKALGDQLAEHALDGDVDLGDEIDRALLVDLEIAAELLHLQLAGADHRLDRRGRDRTGRDRSGSVAWIGVGGTALDHAHFHAALGRAGELHVVHEAADQEYAAAARLQQIFRSQRIGDAPRDRILRPDRAPG